jgi:spore coat protein CotH
MAPTRRPLRTHLGLSLGFLLAAACGGGNAGKDAGPNWGDTAIPQITPEQIGNQVFDESQVRSYYLTFSQEEYAKLMDFSTILLTPYTVNKDRWVKAALKVGDTELPAVGVRFKGNYSIWGCIDSVTHQRISRVQPFFGNVDVCQRFSLKLDFDRYDERFRLDGLKKLNLHAMAADPSKLRERLGYSLFRDMGIPASRAVHARVYVNGAYQGVFAVVEEVDGRFTANRFPSAGDGNLYRDLWPSAVTTESDAKNALRTNDEPDVADVKDFMRFTDALVASTEADFAARMAPYLDFDYLARYIVVDRALNNFDSIMSFYYGPGWGPNNQNYNWYNVGDGHFVLIPWDFDKILWYPEPNFWSDNAPHDNGPVPNWNVVTSGCNGYSSQFDAAMVRNGVTTEGQYQLQAIDCDPFLSRLRNEIYSRQKAMADAFVAGPFSEQSVSAKIETWRAQIAAAMAEDPLADSAHWQTWVGNLRADVPKFQNNLRLMMSGLITE